MIDFTQKGFVRFVTDYVNDRTEAVEVEWLNYTFELDLVERKSASLSRALLIILANGESQNSNTAALAIELIHNASLIVDDVIDGSLLRRGRPSFWKHFGVLQAHIASHIFIQNAFQLLYATTYETHFKNTLISSTFEVIREMAINEVRAEKTDITDLDDYMERCISRSGVLYGLVGKFMTLDALDESQALKMQDALTQVGAVHQILDDLIDSDPSINYSFMFKNRAALKRNEEDSIYSLSSEHFGKEEFLNLHSTEAKYALDLIRNSFLGHTYYEYITQICANICGIQTTNKSELLIRTA